MTNENAKSGFSGQRNRSIPNEATNKAILINNIQLAEAGGIEPPNGGIKISLAWLAAPEAPPEMSHVREAESW